MPASYRCCADAIGGTASQAGTLAFTIQAKDDAGSTARQAFSIAISPLARLEITFPTTCCNAGSVGQSYLRNLCHSGGVARFAASIAHRSSADVDAAHAVRRGACWSVRSRVSAGSPTRGVVGDIRE
jgi:hypothetical protein